MTMNGRAAIAMTLFLVSDLTAQVRVVRYADDRLVGISEVDALVTVAGADAGCGVQRERLQTLVVHRLGTARIPATLSEKNRSSPFSLVVDLRVEQAGDLCVAAVTTELVAEVSGIPETDRQPADGNWGSLLVGYMPLVHDKALVIAPAIQHDAAVRSAVDTQVAAIAARIRSANP
jgi:hypothetical protein